MDIKRKAARGIAVLAVALAAGHLVQTMGEKKAAKPVASAELAIKPTQIEPVAAGPEVAKPVAAASVTAADPAPAAVATAITPAITPAPAAAPAVVAPDTQVAALDPKVDMPVAEPATPALPVAETLTAPEKAPETQIAGGTCDVTLDLLTEDNAMIGVTLVAPCHPNQRVVLRQGGLAVTGQTTSTGALFTALPAFETQAMIEASFADGVKATAEIAVPDLASLRRFGVQWQADDAFQVHAFEDGAAYGEPGHVSAATPNRPGAGMDAKGGFLTLAGDATVENPLLAEVYTFPADPAAKPEVVVEAEVTEKTCGRELIAETLTSMGGSVFITDLTLAMPDCDAIGDYLVLKNLVLDLNMAAVN